MTENSSAEITKNCISFTSNHFFFFLNWYGWSHTFIVIVSSNNWDSSFQDPQRVMQSSCPNNFRLSANSCACAHVVTEAHCAEFGRSRRLTAAYPGRIFHHRGHPASQWSPSSSSAWRTPTTRRLEPPHRWTCLHRDHMTQLHKPEKNVTTSKHHDNLFRNWCFATVQVLQQHVVAA